MCRLIRVPIIDQYTKHVPIKAKTRPWFAVVLIAQNSLWIIQSLVSIFKIMACSILEVFFSAKYGGQVFF